MSSVVISTIKLYDHGGKGFSIINLDLSAIYASKLKTNIKI